MSEEHPCHCWLCVEPDGLDAREKNMVWQVQEHGWSVVAVADEHELPGWAYSVGMWHTMRSPEVCMFGLRGRDMHTWINAVGQQVRAGQPLRVDEERLGVLDGFPVMVRPVHESWYVDLFGYALDFYREPPLPVLQLIWPDRHGVFPWQPGAGDRCRAHQPLLWLPKADHPPSLWTRLAELSTSPFPDAGINELVVGSKRVISGEAPIVGIVHTHDGRWEFLDAAPVHGEDDLGMVHLRHLVSDHPHIGDFADLPRGHAAWQEEDGNWSRAPFTPDPRS
ncbi:DUF4262 domain-containing protein [Actinophytocola sp.]|uniref:DUF4262 domain-containing protein n=1 Tax=Actinophytocola sp. TaxID=1872138 RepID=UPI0025BAEAC4|nr:DUF4262 domain-containing protein [Actinophytocola sp.]